MPADETEQLELIRKSVFKPEVEREAKILLLKGIYEDVKKGYSKEAPNGGELADIPQCVTEYLSGKRKEPCEDDMNFTFNAIKVLQSRYMVKNPFLIHMETPSMVMKRVAQGFSSRVDAKRLYELLIKGRFMFNSPTLFNMYANGAKGALSACYVTPVFDSMEGILEGVKIQALTFKYGGGQGFSFSELRPRGDIVAGTSGVASGPLSFMRLYDVATDVVKQGGKRRGANMGILHIWHPDIYNPDYDGWQALSNTLPPQIKAFIRIVKDALDQIESDGLYEVNPLLKEMAQRLSAPGLYVPEDAGFIQAKKSPLQDSFLTNFNISVGVNDAFMETMIKAGGWWMVNPRYSEDKNGIYRIHYSVSKATGLGRLGKLIDRDGKLLENPYINIFEDTLEASKSRAIDDLLKSKKLRGEEADFEKRNTRTWKYNARLLWEEIVKAAWEGGDPGLIFPDNHNKWNPTPWLGMVVATNPCGEQHLYPFESCNLGSIDLSKYIKDGKFDLEAFSSDIEVIIDSMDAVIDLNKHPDERQSSINLVTRKIGLGIMGLANALAKLGYPYDSDEAVAFTLVAMAALEVFAWKRSWELGAKLGHAPAFECKSWDWKEMKCLEKASVDETVALHTPALIKAKEVLSVEDGWIKVKYHNVKIPAEIKSRLVGETKNRVQQDGTIKLIKESKLMEVLEKVFDIKDLNGIKEVNINDKKALLALALADPERVWDIIKAYGISKGAKGPRNTVVSTVAPTGTISIISGTSSGIEPYFALVYLRRVAVGEFLETISIFRDKMLEVARKYSLSEEFMEELFKIISSHKGSLRWSLGDIEKYILSKRKISDENGRIVIEDSNFNAMKLIEEIRGIANLFPTSMDFDLWYHLSHQIAAQIYTDQAISKTINLPSDASLDSVYSSYFVAWLGGLKGVTIYRDESKGVQVIYFGGESKETILKPLRLKKKTRMALIKREMNIRDLESDRRLSQLFGEVKETRKGVLSLRTDENSTCKTCDL
ncbi:MAG: adenosylcobalamin-dependent ribonucleoside-diphosphate reductase [Caldisphaeraceae archaeon]|nr:adenosylcobalamin-dependent ribonucleoside-diphosphate reductase [Caldisphaeraceae archaeon]